MEDDKSTTSTTDNAADATGTTTAPNTETDQNQTGSDANNQDSSQSTDANAGDGDQTKTDTNKPEDTPAKFDDDIDEWIDKRKLPKPANDDDKQAYQDLRNSQREFTREQQAKKDAKALEEEVAAKKSNVEEDPDEDPLEKKVRLLQEQNDSERDARLRSEFYISNKVSSDEHKAILDIFKEKMEAVAKADPATQQKVLDTWSTPEALRDLLDLAKARVSNASSSTNTEIAEKAAQDERERIARESQAKSTSPSARNYNPTDTSLGDERTKSLLDRYSKK